MLTCSYDGLCRVWDTCAAKCLTTMVPPSRGSGLGVPAVSFAKFSPNGSKLLHLGLLDWDFAQDFAVSPAMEIYLAINLTFCFS